MSSKLYLCYKDKQDEFKPIFEIQGSFFSNPSMSGGGHVVVDEIIKNINFQQFIPNDRFDNEKELNGGTNIYNDDLKIKKREKTIGYKNTEQRYEEKSNLSNAFERYYMNKIKKQDK